MEKEIKEEYLGKFKNIPYGKYAEEFLKTKKDYHDLGTLEGIKFVIKEISKNVPDFSNKNELVHNYTTALFELCITENKRTFFEFDLAMSLFKSEYLLALKQEYQIKQIIPNLENIIRDIVKEEIKKTKN